MKKIGKIFTRIIGIFLLIFGVLIVFGDPIPGTIFMFLGWFLLFYKRILNKKSKDSPTVTDSPVISKGFSFTPPSKLSKEIIKYSIYPAWSNKYDGIDSFIQDIKDNNEPYGGLSSRELREHFENDGSNYYEYPFQELYDLKFIPEPNNPYNPEAVKIVSEEHGMIGYVPDKNLARVNNILRNHPKAKICLEIYGGNYKYLEIDDIREQGKIRIEEGEFKHRIRFEYEKI